MEKQGRDLKDTATREPDTVGTDKKAENPVVLDWTVWLARESGWIKTAAAIAVILGILLLGAYLYKDVFLVSISGAILFLATAEYFFPMRFRLTREAAFKTTLFGTKYIAWTRVKKCYYDEEDKGIKLSPLDKRSRTEGLRGLFLYYGENKDELVEAVRDLSSRDQR